MSSDYTPAEVAAMLERDEIELIDVREPYEYEAGRIAGARHIELASLSAEAQTIGVEKPIVFYCRSGSRSAMAAEAFKTAGFDAHNMAGGLQDWQADGLALEPANGHVA
jgi:rhodanese-related sulfurtransferase